MARKVWIEVALNGPWGQARQPGIPVTVETIVAEGIACARAGACIVHVHAYEAGQPQQTFAWESYARIIEGIRAAIDVPVYPSIPSAGIGGGGAAADMTERFRHIEELARRGLIELAVIDPGSVNFTVEVVDLADPPAHVYLNPEAHIRHALAFAARHAFHPAYAIYEPGFTRAGAALAKATPGCPTPLYRFMLSDGFAWGLPPTPAGLAAHAALLERVMPGAPWMVAGLDLDVRPLLGPAIAMGGHVRVGLEDAPLGDTRGNVAWTELAVAAVRAAGAEPATAAELRAALHGAG